MSSMNKWRPAMVATACLAVAGAITAADALSQVGVSVEVARQEVIVGVERGLVNYSVAAPAFKAASGSVRAHLAQGAIAWAKTYTASAEFKTEYAGMRDARKPAPPDFQGTPEDERQQQLDQQTTEIEKTKAALASMDPEMRKQMEDAMNQAAAAMRQLETPEMRKMQLAGIRHTRAEATAKQKEALQQWDAAYPEDPARVIARRLKTFLAISADVDYAAKLEERNGRMRFVDAAYEDKSSEWKLCYRAGKETVDAARHAAAAWLKELESAKPATAY
jgi:hypothetical protein